MHYMTEFSAMGCAFDMRVCPDRRGKSDDADWHPTEVPTTEAVPLPGTAQAQQEPMIGASASHRQRERGSKLSLLDSVGTL